MPTFDIEYDGVDEHEIEPWEFVDKCDKDEIEDLIDYLREEGKLLPCSCEKLEQSNPIVLRTEWLSIINKLMYNQHQLSNEEETIIFNIANKLG